MFTQKGTRRGKKKIEKTGINSALKKWLKKCVVVLLLPKWHVSPKLNNKLKKLPIKIYEY